MTRHLSLLFLLLVACETSGAQDIAARVATLRDGEVRLALPAREGVCGDGGQLLSVRGSLFIENLSTSSTHRWRERCVHGPMRIRLKVYDGRIDRLQISVSGEWDDRREGVLDLGTLPAESAANYLLSLGEALSGQPAARAITAAALVDSVTIWPQLLRMVRRTGGSKGARHEALFWLSVFAGDKSAGGVEDLDEDQDDEKSHAVFVLHEMKHGEGTPELLRIAKENKNPSVRRKALFWLGQDGDPRAIDLFEQILRQK